MSLPPSLYPTLKAAILADPQFSSMIAIKDWPAIANILNVLFSPPWIVWRTSVSRTEIYNNTSAESTTWSWTFYKNQSSVEQGAWVQMFLNDVADFSKANLRSGVTVIFTGAAAANATHALAVGKRAALYGEKILSTGTGSTATPATMGYEGNIQPSDVQNAMQS